MSEIQGNPTIQFLTDDIIALYSGENVLTDYRDINGSYTTRIEPWPNGVLDKRIFGSIFSDQCNCGKVRAKGMLCHACGSRVNDDIEAYKNFARIELPCYYCSKIKFDQLVALLKGIFPTIEYKFSSTMFIGKTINHPIVMENCQFSYDAEEDKLICTDEIDDYTKCSYEGLQVIIMKYKPQNLTSYTSYINASILVVPIIMRPPIVTYIDGQRRWKMHYITSVYQNIIYAVHKYFEEVDGTLNSHEEHALLRGCLRRFVSNAMLKMSALMRTSKENLARNMGTTRLTNSGRCTIIPGVDLKLDEVRIPRHLMYEACREEFTKFIADEFNISTTQADFLYKTQATSDEIQKLFDRYVEGDEKRKGKYVMINRAPSLYELSLATCKVKLTNDYAMQIPLGLCRPFGGDFDGDQMAWYVIGDDFTDLMVEKLSPRNLFYYKKNNKPLYTPEQDILSGLLLATKIRREPEVLTFGSIEDAEEYRKTHRDFKVQTVCIIDGKETTIGRAKLSEYFGTDIDAAFGIDTPIDAAIADTLMSKLVIFDDRIERYKKIEDFAMYVVTIVGVTAPSIEELYMNSDSKFLKQIRKVQDSDQLTDREKDITIRELYQKYTDDIKNNLDPMLKMKVDDAVRTKSKSLIEIMSPQMNVMQDGTVKIAQTTMIEGMSQEDFINHATENRNVFDIKNMGTPNGGNLTRQFVFLGAGYSFKDEYDETNTGILLEANKAEGRTSIDGKILGKSDSTEMVKVRSCVSTKRNDRVLTKDMISSVVPFKDGENIGISYISSFTEGMTQSSLSLNC